MKQLLIFTISCIIGRSLVWAFPESWELDFTIGWIFGGLTMMGWLYYDNDIKSKHTEQ